MRVSVLVVDDSAVVRQALTLILSRARGFHVDVASDPVIAREKMQRVRPDVIVLDLEMPRMDGLTFLRTLMTEREPVPVVVCSGLVGPGAEAAVLALEEGAVSIVAKPKLGVRGFLHDQATALVETVRAAAKARVRSRGASRPSATAPAPLPDAAPSFRHTTDRVVAMGASTGGTEVLREILMTLPPDAPGTVIVQHMPELFTRAFADRLNAVCRVEVKEAENGDRLSEGRVLVAPGNRHTLLRRSGAHYVVEVVEGPPVSRHRPSVDVLFRSVAEAAGPNAVGVLLTGMGRDGAEGLLEMKQAGAATIAQDEESCVVFGMPREAIVLGAVDDVAPPARIATLLLQRARRGLDMAR